MSIDTQTFFLFILSGFITVWSFRYFTKSSKTAEFEYIGLGAFWGMALLIIFELIPWMDKTKLNDLLNNQYAYGFTASIAGFFFGWLGSCISREKWFKKIIHYLSTR